MIPIVVLASGRGSNFEAIYCAIQSGVLKAEIRAVISDRPDAIVLQKAEGLRIPAISIPVLNHKRQDHEKKILDELKKWKPRFLVLAGYMRILTPLLIDSFRAEQGYTRIVNIHPSLLPAFPGVGAYGQAFRYGSMKTGVTVHLVESEVDGGPICMQESFSIDQCHSESDVEKAGLELEHRIFPQALAWILSEKFKVERRSSGRLCVRKS